MHNGYYRTFKIRSSISMWQKILKGHYCEIQYIYIYSYKYIPPDRIYRLKNVIGNILHSHCTIEICRWKNHFKLITFSLSCWTKYAKTYLSNEEICGIFYADFRARSNLAPIISIFLPFIFVQIAASLSLSLSFSLFFRTGCFSRISIFKCNEVLAFFVFHETAVCTREKIENIFLTFYNLYDFQLRPSNVMQINDKSYFFTSTRYVTSLRINLFVEYCNIMFIFDSRKQHFLKLVKLMFFVFCYVFFVKFSVWKVKISKKFISRFISLNTKNRKLLKCTF